MDSSGNRVGNGWCADVFMMKSGEMDNLIRTREGLLTAGINRTISESADINVQELSPTVDLNKANGIRLTAFAYRGGSHIGGLFDIADQSKPIEIYIDRNKRVTTDGVISPKEKDNMCGWNGV